MNYNKSLIFFYKLWDFSNYGSDKKEEEKHEEEYELCNIRGHSGYVIAANFYAENSNFVITGN